MATFYWWKGLFQYKAEFSGNFSVWTDNRDHGDAATMGQRGKAFFFFAEPQAWVNGKSIKMEIVMQKAFFAATDLIIKMP